MADCRCNSIKPIRSSVCSTFCRSRFPVCETRFYNWLENDVPKFSHDFSWVIFPCVDHPFSWVRSIWSVMAVFSWIFWGTWLDVWSSCSSKEGKNWHKQLKIKWTLLWYGLTKMMKTSMSFDLFEDKNVPEWCSKDKKEEDRRITLTILDERSECVTR